MANVTYSPSNENTGSYLMMLPPAMRCTRNLSLFSWSTSMFTARVLCVGKYYAQQKHGNSCSSSIEKECVERETTATARVCVCNVVMTFIYDSRPNPLNCLTFASHCSAYNALKSKPMPLNFSIIRSGLPS